MRIRRRLIAGIGVIAIAVATLLVAVTAGAATQTVTNNADSGAGSLRAAVAAAAANDTINFAPALNGQTITLTTGVIALTENLTLDASGMKVTIDGNSASRIFTVAASKTVSLKHLTLQHGQANGGGAIQSSGILTVNDSVFTTNVSTGGNGDGAAILNSGALTVNRSIFTLGQSGEYGGAIENSSSGTSLVIDRSSFTNNNSADDGGALDNSGSGVLWRITNSTFTGNNSGGCGGAIYNGVSHAVISSSTFARNHATDPKSGAFCGPPKIADSIVANNTVGVSNTPGSCSAAITGANDQGNNLQFGDATCAFALGSDVTGDPKLGPTQDNGGGLPTAALGAGSAAIDVGTCTDPNSGGAAITTDERGVPRPQGAGCDIGAFELDAVAPTVTLSFPSANGPNNTYTGSVSGTVSASNSGLVENLTCTGATLSNVTGLGTTSATGTLTVSGTGPVTVTCTATDLSGNQQTASRVLAFAVPGLPQAGAAQKPAAPVSSPLATFVLGLLVAAVLGGVAATRRGLTGRSW
jgi:hypothetical protein